jgi:hypothetical protein
MTLAASDSFTRKIASGPAGHEQIEPNHNDADAFVVGENALSLTIANGQTSSGPPGLHVISRSQAFARISLWRGSVIFR